METDLMCVPAVPAVVVVAVVAASITAAFAAAEGDRAVTHRRIATLATGERLRDLPECHRAYEQR
jgi:hypothetical protein